MRGTPDQNQQSRHVRPAVRRLAAASLTAALLASACASSATPAPAGETPAPPTAESSPAATPSPAVTLHAVTPTPTVEPTSTPSPTPSHTPTRRPTPRPTPTLIGSGYSDPVAAIKAWIVGQGFNYSLDCATAWSDESDVFYCYSFDSHVSVGDVYMIGPRGSQPAYYMLVRRVGGLWYVAAVATIMVDGRARPVPWH